jgi:acetoin utilization protein AcuB
LNWWKFSFFERKRASRIEGSGNFIVTTDNGGRLTAMHVQDVMTAEVVTVRPVWQVKKVWEMLQKEPMHCFPVVDGDEVVGIITDRDLRILATASSVALAEQDYHEFLMENMSIESAMTREPRTVAPETDLKEAAQLMLEMRVGGLPVVDGERLVGILTETDLIRVLAERFL